MPAVSAWAWSCPAPVAALLAVGGVTRGHHAYSAGAACGDHEEDPPLDGGAEVRAAPLAAQRVHVSTEPPRVEERLFGLRRREPVAPQVGGVGCVPVEQLR